MPKPLPKKRIEKVYLVCFESPFKHARHYLGKASDIQARIDRHLAGNGARLLRAVNLAGIKWTVVRMWEGEPGLEALLKKRKCNTCLCPVCNPDALKYGALGRPLELQIAMSKAVEKVVDKQEF